MVIFLDIIIISVVINMAISMFINVVTLCPEFDRSVVLWWELGRDALTAPEIDIADIPNADVYVANLGRIAHRLRKGEEMFAMDRVVDVVGEIFDKEREEIGKDLLSVMPPRVKKEIEDQVSAINEVLSPLPITLRLKGLKVKLDFDEFHEQVSEVSFVEGVKLKDIADIRRSNMKNFILVDIKTKSETGFLI